jgi:hypothetical protein
MASGDLIPRVYSNFRGVDFRGDEINLKRSPDSLNVWKDYKEIDSIRTRPKMEALSGFDDTVYGIYFYKAADTDMMIIHSGTKLYKVVGDERSVLFEGANTTKSNAFIYNNVWYFKDGVNYLRYYGAEIGDVVGYIPTTSIARKPSGGGKIYEDVNMLSDYRINTFLSDKESKEFHLDAKNIDSDFKPEVMHNGVKYPGDFSVDYEKGVIAFDYPLVSSLTDGQDDVVVKFKKSIDRGKILKCNMLEVFDNRVFFSGNPDFPNVIWHCSLNDPSYCSDLDYYNEGLDTAEVKDMVAGNNALWVFKEPSQANTTVFYHTPTIDSEYGKIYPNTHSNISTGCIGRAINFNDDIVFFSDRGMEGISGDITTEQAIAHRSTVVDRKLIAEPDYSKMILVEWEGYLIVIVGNKAYLADSRATYTNETHYEYEWFYWEFDKNITCAKVNKCVLYLGTDDGIYTLTDNEGNLESYWVTPKDKFKHPQFVKTTNKRGCVVEATGDISVYTKIEKTDFEFIGSYENIEDYFVSRIKRKKFKDIQLKFYSNTRFSLETATLECFVGGYTKR